MQKIFLVVVSIFFSTCFFTHGHEYKPDILGENFEQLTIQQPDDYEGKVVCTLIRDKLNTATAKAVLYVHGFNDYFFQKDMAATFVENGYAFYALDLRKYGRSYLQHQKFNNVRNLNEYYADLDSALTRIANEGYSDVVLCGHSTGGLLVSVYANDHPQSSLFDALFANSPFYNYNEPFLKRTVGVALISAFGNKNPNKLVKGSFSELYGLSLNKQGQGEWDYDLKLKPYLYPPVNQGFIRAIHVGHKKVRKGLIITVPVLVMHSDKSIYEKNWSDKLFTGDAVLNVKHIEKGAERIKGNVTIKTIDGGMHDLVLSKKTARDKTYKELFEWLNALRYD